MRESFCWPAGLNNIRRTLVTTTQLRMIKKFLVRIAIAIYRTALYFTHCPISSLQILFTFDCGTPKISAHMHTHSIMHTQYLLILADKKTFSIRLSVFCWNGLHRIDFLLPGILPSACARSYERFCTRVW